MTVSSSPNPFFTQAPLSDVVLIIANKGAEVVETNYWATAAARLGNCYLSLNAGVYRLLVPKESEKNLSEMRTGKSVTIEPSRDREGWWNVWFEDGTDETWRLELHQHSMNFIPRSHCSRFAVWTEAGKVLELPCEVQPNGC